jgi:nucleoside-diphosphate-sugar epimerase
MQSITIVGCGYTGLRLARRWRDLGADVCGIATLPKSLAAIAASGSHALALDLDADADADADTEESATRSGTAAHGSAPLDVEGRLVYYSVPPAPQGRNDERFERLLRRIVGRPRRLIYLGTTGVYGDHAGALVDEDTPPSPISARAVRRLAAENALREWAGVHDLPWCILRIAGIYGPGRLPLERLRRGDPAIAPGESLPTNRIHVDDLVSACVAAGFSPRADRCIINVTDGSDECSTRFLQRVARLADLPEPPLISRDVARNTFTESAWSFLRESRRVDNRRMREVLGVALAYHDLDAGIRASLAAR